MIRFFVLLAFMVFAISCDRTNQAVETTKQSGPGEGGYTPAKLLLFGAPWCGECKKELPEVNQLLKEHSAAFREALTIQVLVTTGAERTDMPTQEIADELIQSLGLAGMEALPDPKWEVFKKYLGRRLVGRLPAAVIIPLGPDGGEPILLKPGTYVAQDVLLTLKEVMQ